MKNNYLVILVLGVLVLIGLGAFSYSSKNNDAHKDDAMMEKTEVMQDDKHMDDGSMDDGSDAMMEESKLMDEESKAMMDKDKTMGKKDDVMMASEGKYIVYTPEDLAAAHSRRVLYFYANWCPTCKTANKDFQDNIDKLPKDVTILRVNYNDTDTDKNEKDLAKKYGITYQHTFVQIDENGVELMKWNGGGVEELLDKIK